MNPEREIVNLWLNKKGFFTISSLPLPNNKIIDILAVKISNAKIGSSPLYYVTGQEEKLEALYSHLKEPEKKVYDLPYKIMRGSIIISMFFYLLIVSNSLYQHSLCFPSFLQLPVVIGIPRI